MNNENVQPGADETVKSYPTTPDADGYYYEDEGSETLKIETRVNGDDMFKRVQLGAGRKAVLRELTGAETNKAAKIAGKNQDKVMAAYVALSATITDKDDKVVPFVAEDLDLWKGKDVNRLITACSQLNF